VLTYRNGELGVYGVSGHLYGLCPSCGAELNDLISSFVQSPDRVVITVSDRRLLGKMHVIMRALNALSIPYTHLDLVWVGYDVLVKLRDAGQDRVDSYTINLQTGVLSPVAKPKGEAPCVAKS
jgi:hypothetical protein